MMELQDIMCINNSVLSVTEIIKEKIFFFCFLFLMCSSYSKIEVHHKA